MKVTERLIESSSDEELQALVAHFERQTSNPDREVRIMAVRALKDAREEPIARELLRGLHRDPDKSESFSLGLGHPLTPFLKRPQASSPNAIGDEVPIIHGVIGAVIVLLIRRQSAVFAHGDAGNRVFNLLQRAKPSQIDADARKA